MDHKLNSFSYASRDLGCRARSPWNDRLGARWRHADRTGAGRRWRPPRTRIGHKQESIGTSEPFHFPSILCFLRGGSMLLPCRRKA